MQSVDTAVTDVALATNKFFKRMLPAASTLAAGHSPLGASRDDFPAAWSNPPATPRGQDRPAGKSHHQP